MAALVPPLADSLLLGDDEAAPLIELSELGALELLGALGVVAFSSDEVVPPDCAHAAPANAMATAAAIVLNVMKCLLTWLGRCTARGAKQARCRQADVK
jgi:hypothetical protein